MSEQMPFVDTHVHFFDFKVPELTWSWLERDFNHPLLGDIDGMKGLRFTAPELAAESRMSGTTKCVHVQAALGTEDPVLETQWLSKMADEHGMPNAIVGDASLADPDVGSVLERHAMYERVRGVRDFGEGDYYVADDWRRGYALLEEHGFSCDLDVFFENMGKARDLAETFPNTPLIVDHAGFPQERTEEYYAGWRAGVSDLAGAPNVMMKISGLGMKDAAWTVDSLRPWVMHCIEAFGTERCFFGTNWPLDRLYSSYTDVVAAYRQLIGDFSVDEQRALLAGNAERIYRV